MLSHRRTSPRVPQCGCIFVITAARKARGVTASLRVGLFGVGGGTAYNAVTAFDAYPAWDAARIGGGNQAPSVREVGTTELWLPAASPAKRWRRNVAYPVATILPNPRRYQNGKTRK
jgi:hypothetical protein